MPRTNLVVLILLASPVLSAGARPLPLRPATMGSAIAVEYSIHPDSLRPGDAVPILACVANQNPSSTRELESGDAFTFEFTRGALGSCAGVRLALPGSTLAESDFACAISGSTLTLSYAGPNLAWPPGEAICASLDYTPENAPSMVLTRTVARRVGGHAPADDAGVLLGVATDLGVAGPTGPIGPAGPPGPPGTSGIGYRELLLTTGEAEAYSDEPPVPIPGLETTVNVTDGASLLVLLDLSNYPCYTGAPASAEARVHVEIDGQRVASRNLEHHYQEAVNVHLSWLSGPLAPGSHTIRALVSDDDTSTIGHYPVRCVGNVAIPSHPGRGRMIVMEVLP